MAVLDHPEKKMSVDRKKNILELLFIKIERVFYILFKQAERLEIVLWLVAIKDCLHFKILATSRVT